MSNNKKMNEKSCHKKTILTKVYFFGGVTIIGSSSSPGASPFISKLMHLLLIVNNEIKADFIGTKKLDVLIMINVLILMTVDFAVIITGQSKR